MRNAHLTSIAAALLLAGGAPRGRAAAPESFLGAYLHLPSLFDASADPSEREHAIAAHLDRFRDAGLRVLIPFVVSTTKSAYYPSRVLADQPYGDWDALAFLTREGRERGLRIYPAICVLPSGRTRLAGPLEQHPDWAVRDKTGAPLPYISPGHPDARKWVVSMIEEVAARYQPDGVLLDYLRFPGNEARMDPVSQARFDKAHPADRFPRDGAAYRDALLKFKRQSLTELAGQISDAVRALRPAPRIAVYMWGAHELARTRDWRTWVERGYVDMLNLTGYYFAKKKGPDYLAKLEEQFRTVGAILRETGAPVEFTMCVGIRTSHGQIAAASQVDDYLRIAKRCGVHGAAFFTWSSLEPYLADVKRGRYIERFLDGLPPRPQGRGQ